jgi:hypothetical protein
MKFYTKKILAVKKKYAFFDIAGKQAWYKCFNRDENNLWKADLRRPYFFTFVCRYNKIK